MEQVGPSPSSSRRKSGRPLSFDREAALDQAMLTFWRHGYETTSIADLTAAMGLNPPSLYAAFGDKKRLFLEAARRYADMDAVTRAIEAAPSAPEAARAMLVAAATAYTGTTTPRGCLLASATASGSAASADVQAVVADMRRAIRDQLRRRIDQDVATGALEPSIDPTGLADFTMAVAQGMSVLARDGASRAALLRVVETALGAWPTPP